MTTKIDELRERPRPPWISTVTPPEATWREAPAWGGSRRGQGAALGRAVVGGTLWLLGVGGIVSLYVADRRAFGEALVLCAVALGGAAIVGGWLWSRR